MDKKPAIPTDITIIELKADESLFRPFVALPGVKSTNAVTILTSDSNISRWKLFNHVLPQVPANMGRNITSNVCDGINGKRTTPKMRDPGAIRKKRKAGTDPMNPKTIGSQHQRRMKFIKDANLEDCLDDLKIEL